MGIALDLINFISDWRRTGKPPEQLPHSVAYFLGYCIFLCLILLIGWYFSRGNIAFASFMIITMLLGRKLGWALSKNFLYTSHIALAVLACFVWGLMVAGAIDTIIAWQRPNIFLKILMGYMLGAYVSIPNYGLIKEETIPFELKSRHAMLSTVSLLIYLLYIIQLIIFL